jgi:hypothetical protein
MSQQNHALDQGSDKTQQQPVSKPNAVHLTRLLLAGYGQACQLTLQPAQLAAAWEAVGEAAASYCSSATLQNGPAQASPKTINPTPAAPSKTKPWQQSVKTALNQTQKRQASESIKNSKKTPQARPQKSNSIG